MATYYVSTTGNDSADGSIGTPWLTWQHGFDTIVAGDTLYIRGGLYQPIGTFIHNPFGTDWYACAGVNNKSGTALLPITVRNYPGETPIISGENNNASNNGGAGSRFMLLFRRCSYWNLYGLEVRNLLQLPGELGVGVVRFYDYSHHNRVEQLNVHHNGGSGICFIYDCDDNDMVNCDSHDNYDHLSVPTPGNNSDGIEIADITVTTYVNRITGCRCWDNSDDGIDLMRNEGTVIIDNTWCFINGQTAEYQATGFKLGNVNSDLEGVYQRILRNCIAANNYDGGIVLNNALCKVLLYNNTIKSNGWHGVTWYLSSGTQAASIIRNNISYNNYSYDFSYINTGITTFDHNTYSQYDTSTPAATDADFVSVDYTEMLRNRQTDGSLPYIDYMRLKSTSSLIDAGVDVSLPYYGSNPDMGVFEYDNESINISTPCILKFGII